MALISYKCPACGGPLKWDAAKQKYGCEYCRSEYTQADLDKLEENATTEKTQEAQAAADMTGKQNDQAGAIRTYSCPSCGAQIVTDGTTAASKCYYCHNPIVLSEKLTGTFKPDCIIPFAIDRKKAQQIFKDWVKKHQYIPADFYSDSQVEMLSGVYFPYWIYNANVNGSVRGRGINDRVWVQGETQFTETTTYEINKSGEMPVSNISRIALNKASKVLCESVAPFDEARMKPFEYGYLSGYVAESRDVESAAITPEIHQEVEEFAKAQLQGGVYGEFQKVQLESVNTDIKSESFKYALMPVWTLTYKGRDGKVYYFSINGDSGKTVGELPVDKTKLIGLFAKVAVPVLVGLLALFHFLG